MYSYGRPAVGVITTVAVINDDNSETIYQGVVTTRENPHGPLYLLSLPILLLENGDVEHSDITVQIGRDYEGKYWPSSRVAILEDSK